MIKFDRLKVPSEGKKTEILDGKLSVPDKPIIPVIEGDGIGPDIMKATINEYNSCCDRGHDESFAKEAKYLQALHTPPYHAVRCYPRFSTTIGGIKINHRMEVLNHTNEPIPGLYAGGDAAGGWEHDTYNVMLSGFAFGFALNSGRIAGENAASYILEE